MALSILKELDDVKLAGIVNEYERSVGSLKKYSDRILSYRAGMLEYGVRSKASDEEINNIKAIMDACEQLGSLLEN